MSEHVKDLFMKAGFALVVIAVLVGGCATYINEKLGLQEDNSVEEAIEKEINEMLNVDVDLTPNTVEAKKRKATYPS